LELEEDAVRCLALPIVGEKILVPNAVVAEVFAADSVSPVAESANWLLGSLTWRGQVLPLVCMEAALGGDSLEADGRSKIVVLNTFSAREPLKNFAILVQGIPHQVLATDHTVQLETPINGARPFVTADLLVEGERALIPDLDAIEQALLDLADQWQGTGLAGSDEGGAG
jgi:chemosensory pili system protein ChpC